MVLKFIKIRICKYLFWIFVPAIFSLSANAQLKHEVFFSTATGSTSLDYTTNFGDSKMKLGAALGLGYSLHFAPGLSVSTGAEWTAYRGGVDINQFNSIQYGVKDIYNDPFEYRSAVTNYNEKQTASYINIPLMFNYESGMVKKFYYISAGLKFGIPISSSNNTKSVGNYFNEGYFTNRDNLISGPKFMGFGQFLSKEIKSSVEYKFAVIASIETGMKWDVGNNMSLYTGAYFDYGLTNIVKLNEQPLLAYNHSNPQSFANNSILTSSYRNSNNQSKTFTNKVVPVSFGVKMKLGLSFVGAKKIPLIVENDLPVVVPPKIEIEIEPVSSEEVKIQPINETVIQNNIGEFKAVEKVINEYISGYKVHAWDLDDEKRAILDRKVALLKKYPEVCIRCEGFTCDIGSEKINHEIGLKRAKEARDYMVAKGIAPSRLAIDTKSMLNPAFPNDSESNRYKNRRVEFIIMSRAKQ